MKTKTLLNRLIQARVCCEPCGEEYGKQRSLHSDWYKLKCDVCKKKTDVTDTGDFDYLKKGRKALQLVIDKERKAKLEDRLNRVKEVATVKVKKIKEKNKIPSLNEIKNSLRKVTHKIVTYGATKCYTCDTTGVKLFSGHYWTQGGHGAARFDFENMRPQCDQCNRFESGNLAEYGWRLREEIGDERFTALRLKAGGTVKWDKFELLKLLEERREILKKLEDNQ